jgi:hypothetical protein
MLPPWRTYKSKRKYVNPYWLHAMTYSNGYIVVSTKIVSINVPLLLIILVGKSTTCVRLNVFIKVSSFNVSLLGPASNFYNEAVHFRR